MVNPLNIPVINTNRLVLQPLSMKHSQGMFELWSDPAVCEFSGIVHDYDQNVIPTPTTTRQDSDRIIDFWLRAAFDGWGFRWAVVLPGHENPFAGTLGLNSLSECAEIAYHLLPVHWGKGFMAEASRKAIEWLRGHGAIQLEAFIKPENRSSITLAMQLGMKATDAFQEESQRYSMPL
ncbi:MAG: GNAT family N-acetyltransferase [Granulosicoccus sp.]